MPQLHTLLEIELEEQQQKRFDKLFRIEDRSAYLPQVLLFLPIPLMLLLISILRKMGFSPNSISFLWLTLYCNAFIFLALFIRNISKTGDKRRVLPAQFRIFSCEGMIIPSELSSTFVYIDEGYGKVPLQLYHSGRFPLHNFGKAVVIEFKPNEFMLFDFLENGNIFRSNEIGHIPSL
jgi:hypothetical protein